MITYADQPFLKHQLLSVPNILQMIKVLQTLFAKCLPPDSVLISKHRRNIKSQGFINQQTSKIKVVQSENLHQKKPQHPPNSQADNEYRLPIQILQKYEPLKKLGEGAFGIVVCGRNRSDNSLVAIKSCKNNIETPVYGLPPSILKELIALKKLSKSEHVAKLIEFINGKKETASKYHFVFECADFSLKDYLDLNPQLEFGTKIKFIKQLILGVGQIHKANLLHRDLKPDNLLLFPNPSKKGQYDLKIADLGAVVMEAKNQEGLIQIDVGTLWYKPPQVLLGSKQYGIQYDLWSLGVIIVEILCGKAPFRGLCNIDQLFNILYTFGSLQNNKCLNFYKETAEHGAMKLPDFRQKEDNREFKKLEEKIISQIQKEERQESIKEEILGIIWSLLSVDPRERLSISVLVQKYSFLRDQLII